MAPKPELQILLPVHNEAESIAATIDEMYDQISPLARVEFILCEDGSRDNTKEVLRGVARRIPAKLLLSDERKGYSRAVRDGMAASDAPYLLCLDSDGQCDPKDFAEFWKRRDEADVLIGWRVHRADTLMRKVMSRTFFAVWRSLYRVPIHDPSCPFMLARNEIIRNVSGKMGSMREGFWWEFTARVARAGYTIRELPVHHRNRAAGVTQVYHLKKLPRIGYQHFRALFEILRDTSANLTTPNGEKAEPTRIASLPNTRPLNAHQTADTHSR